MFSNKTAVITGASSGLGASLAEELSKHKSNLVLFSRNRERLSKTARLCEKNGAKILIVNGDITSQSDCRNLADETIKNFGPPDQLILNTGISMWAAFEEITDLSLFRKLIETNYLGAVNAVYYFLPHIIKSKGLITVISSAQGRIAVPYHSGYVASKHALTGFFETLRMELKGRGADIMIVNPHWLRGTNLRSNALDKNGKQTGESRKEHSKESISLKECSKRIIKGMKKREKELFIPLKLKALPWLNLISPGLLEKIISKKIYEQSD
jgi:short-subunit dehydrogenase